MRPAPGKNNICVSPRGWAAWPSRCPSEPVPCTDCSCCVSEIIIRTLLNWPHWDFTQNKRFWHGGVGYLSYYCRSTGFSLKFKLISPAFDSAPFHRPWFALFFQICQYLVMFSLLTVPAALRLWIFELLMLLLLTISFLRTGMFMIMGFGQVEQEWCLFGLTSLFSYNPIWKWHYRWGFLWMYTRNCPQNIDFKPSKIIALSTRLTSRCRRNVRNPASAVDLLPVPCRCSLSGIDWPSMFSYLHGINMFTLVSKKTKMENPAWDENFASINMARKWKSIFIRSIWSFNFQSRIFVSGELNISRFDWHECWSMNAKPPGASKHSGRCPPIWLDLLISLIKKIYLRN